MTVPATVLQFVKAHRHHRTLSVYIDGSATDPAERRHWRVELKKAIERVRVEHAGASRAERDQLEACIARVLALLPADGQMLGSPGWTCLCSADGDLHVEPLPVPTNTLVRWNDGPFLVPYLSADGVNASVVVLVDWNGAGLWRLDGGTMTHIASIELSANVEVGSHMGESPRRGFHGGTRGATATDEVQRQLREARARLIETTRQRILALANGNARIVIGGSAEAAAALFAELPPAHVARTVIAADLHVQTPFDEVQRLARAAIAQIGERLQLHWLADSQRRAHAGGHTAFGLEPIAAASAAGAVERMVVSPTLWAEDPEGVEQVVQAALVDGAAVEMSHHAATARLDAEAGGIAAELRFKPPMVHGDAAAPRALVQH